MERIGLSAVMAAGVILVTMIGPGADAKTPETPAVAPASTGAACDNTAASRIGVSPGVLPMMRVSMPCRGSPGRSQVGGYTRIVADFVPVHELPPRDYRDSQRNRIKRFFSGKSISRVLTVKATLARPLVGNTTPLMTVGHNSSREDGETWTTEVRSQRVLTPFFRIDPESTINIEFALNGLTEYDVDVAASLLDVVKRAAVLVTPTSALVTSLNEDRYGQASQFVDQSISRFFREAITERTNNDFPATLWGRGELATVELHLPLQNDLTPDGRAVSTPRPRAADKLVYVGKWIISAEPARLSIFTDAEFARVDTAGRPASVGGPGEVAPDVRSLADLLEACLAPPPDAPDPLCRPLLRLDPAAIVNFEVDAGVTVMQSLAGDDGIAAARDALVKGPTEATARTLCGLVAGRAQELGFNRVDVAAVVGAYVRQDFSSEKARAALLRPETCAPARLTVGATSPA